MQSRCMGVALATGIGQVENGAHFPGSLQRTDTNGGADCVFDISFKTCTDTRNRSCFVRSAKNGIGEKFKFFAIPWLWVSVKQTGSRRRWYQRPQTSAYGWLAGLTLRQACQQGSSGSLRQDERLQRQFRPHGVFVLLSAMLTPMKR